jgi:hypothetical protein
VSQLLIPRARRMEERVLRAANEAGAAPGALPLLGRAYRAAIGPRESGEGALASDHDPAFLHPGRTVLILASELGEADAEVLAIGAVAESRNLEFRLSPGQVSELLGPAGGSRWRDLPEIGWEGRGEEGVEELLEALVTADPLVQRIALAEALDQLRHAHLWSSAAERARAAVLAEKVFVPVAPRAHALLDRRFRWWSRRVGPALAAGGGGTKEG